MIQLRFAFILLHSIGSGIFADIPVNPSMIQKWSGSPQLIHDQPMPQQIINIQNTGQGTRNGYISEDYDGELYDNRLRLMLYPKTSITLNETNLRIWKVNDATYSNWSQTSVTEKYIPSWRSAYDELQQKISEPEKTGKSETNTTTKSQNRLSVGTNSSISDFPFKIMVENSQFFADSIVNVTSMKDQIAGHGMNPAKTASISKIKASNYSAKIISSDKNFESIGTRNGTIFKTNFHQQMNQSFFNVSKSKNITNSPSMMIITPVEKPEKNNKAKDKASDMVYDDLYLEDDYVEEQGRDSAQETVDVPETNSYILVVPDMNKNVSTSQPEIIKNDLFFMLSNLTATDAINGRIIRKILEGLNEQKIQLNHVKTKISNIYELLKKKLR